MAACYRWWARLALSQPEHWDWLGSVNFIFVSRPGQHHHHTIQSYQGSILPPSPHINTPHTSRVHTIIFTDFWFYLAGPPWQRLAGSPDNKIKPSKLVYGEESQSPLVLLTPKVISSYSRRWKHQNTQFSGLNSDNKISSSKFRCIIFSPSDHQI